MWNGEANINQCITIYGTVWDSIKQEKYALRDELFSSRENEIVSRYLPPHDWQQAIRNKHAITF